MSLTQVGFAKLYGHYKRVKFKKILVKSKILIMGISVINSFTLLCILIMTKWIRTYHSFPVVLKISNSYISKKFN